MSRFVGFKIASSWDTYDGQGGYSDNFLLQNPGHAGVWSNNGRFISFRIASSWDTRDGRWGENIMKTIYGCLLFEETITDGTTFNNASVLN